MALDAINIRCMQSRSLAFTISDTWLTSHKNSTVGLGVLLDQNIRDCIMSEINMVSNITKPNINRYAVIWYAALAPAFEV